MFFSVAKVVKKQPYLAISIPTLVLCVVEIHCTSGFVAEFTRVSSTRAISDNRAPPSFPLKKSVLCLHFDPFCDAGV